MRGVDRSRFFIPAAERDLLGERFQQRYRDVDALHASQVNPTYHQAEQ